MLKTVKMQRISALIATNLFALVCIWILNIFLNMQYSSHGSFDVVIGAFIEVMILGAYFEFINARQQKNMEKHLQRHLRQIDHLINQKQTPTKKE